MVQVVPTEYNYLSKEILPTNQFSVTEYFSPMHEFDRTWPGLLKLLMSIYIFIFSASLQEE